MDENGIFYNKKPVFCPSKNHHDLLKKEPCNQLHQFQIQVRIWFWQMDLKWYQLHGPLSQVCCGRSLSHSATPRYRLKLGEKLQPLRLQKPAKYVMTSICHIGCFIMLYFFTNFCVESLVTIWLAWCGLADAHLGWFRWVGLFYKKRLLQWFKDRLTHNRFCRLFVLDSLNLAEFLNLHSCHFRWI